MRLELKQEQAINDHLRENLKQLEARKDEHLSKLASELGNVNAINKRLESELDRTRGELLGGETAINNLKFELMERDRALDNLQTELDNRLGEAARNEIFLTEELNRFKYGIVPGEDRDTPSNPASPQNTQGLKTLIKGWKRQAKNTRDWTKANQLISELENLP